MSTEIRTCSKCVVEQPLTNFRVNRKCRGGRNTVCKFCADEMSEQHRIANHALRKQQDRARNLMNKFGITVAQYNELLEKQAGCCAICNRHKEEFKVNLAVDHNHATGEIRGLLCNYCNHRVIGRHRDGELLRKMADYVDGGTGWFVPKKKKTFKRQKGKRIG